MAGEKITRRQKNISRVLREKKEVYKSRLKSLISPTYRIPGPAASLALPCQRQAGKQGGVRGDKKSCGRGR
ncbi:MAG: hypothetical protein JW994_05390 [Candidatus Omnitrophica bacterium]|nr:hypothetical protein [Candidatus Omnitrophota bacterium]